MSLTAYERTLGDAHGVRLLARELDQRGGLDEAIAYADASRDSIDNATLRTVRILARLRGGESLAGEGIASEPGSGNCPSGANGSTRETHAPSPVQDPLPVAFAGAPTGERKGPPAS